MVVTPVKTHVTRARIREILLEAREKMNDNGAHWIKGRLSRKKSVGQCYCSIGAIFATTSSETERKAAVKALVEKGLEQKLHLSYCTRAYFAGRNQVERWNDNRNTTWKDVNKAFRRAARALR